MISDLIKLPYLLYVFGLTGLIKQCTPRSESVASAILRTFTCSKMDLLKRKYKVKSKGREYVW